MQETVISDAVNLASRVEGLTKLYGAAILISEATLRNLPEPESGQVRFLGRVAVKGRSEATAVYEVLSGVQHKDRVAQRGRFGDALAAYYERRFDDAVGLFAQVLREDPEDRAAALYRHRSAHFITDPPPSDWDGVERLIEK